MSVRSLKPLRCFQPLSTFRDVKEKRLILNLLSSTSPILRALDNLFESPNSNFWFSVVRR